MTNRISEKMKSAAAYKKSRAQRTAELAAIESSSPQSSAPARGTERRPGRPLSEKTAKMTIVMEPLLKQKLKEYCVINQTTSAEVIDTLVRDFFGKQNQ